MSVQTSFHYVHQAGSPHKAPLLLLHGTGGNEHDLLDLAKAVAPDRAVLSPRGQVLENGMPRFFRRFAEGKFDEDDVRQRTHELADFIREACKAYNLSKPIALGFSNGANIAAALLALFPDAVSGAVLLRAMAPFKTMPDTTLAGVPVLLLSGRQDSMIPQTESDRLAAWLTTHKADLQHHTWPTGHGLIQSDIQMMSQFLSLQDERTCN